MKTIGQRELRDRSAAVMDEVESGETIRISRRGVEVAELRPLAASAFVPTADMARRLKRFGSGGYGRLREEADEFFGPGD